MWIPILSVADYEAYTNTVLQGVDESERTNIPRYYVNSDYQTSNVSRIVLFLLFFYHCFIALLFYLCTMDVFCLK